MKHRCTQMPFKATQMSTDMKKIILLLILILLPKLSWAAEVQPAKLELKAPEGKTYNGVLTIVNHKNYDMDIILSSSSYRYVFTKNTIFPDDKAKLPSCQNWIKFEQDKYEVGPGESLRVNYSIIVPEKIGGEYLASILVDEKEVSTPEITQKPKKQDMPAGRVKIAVTQRLTIPVYLIIEGTEKLAAEIKDFKLIKDNQEQNIVEFQAKLKNTGNIHIRPKGNLIIMNSKGKIVKNISSGEILPIFSGYAQIIPLWWKDPSPGEYTAVITIDLGNNSLLQKKIQFEI